MNDSIQYRLLRDELEPCVAPVEKAFSLPPKAYVSKDVCELEKTFLLKSVWLGLGRADLLLDVGNFETLELLGIGIILVRDKDGQLKAFNNACRHRGAKLVEGQGSCNALRCPFHGWTYATNGNLIGAAHMQDTKCFSKANYSLIEFPLEIYQGFLFIHLGENPQPFDEWIDDFDQFHSPWNLCSLKTVRRRSFTVECNWKQFLDVFNEYYHLQYVHPETINSLYLTPEPADKNRGEYATQFGFTRGTGALMESQQADAFPTIASLTDRERRGARYTWLFPNMTFAAGSDALWVYEALPINEGQCLVTQTLCFPQETLSLPDFDKRAQQYYQRMDQAIEEDRIALENQFAGLKSPFAKQGRFSVTMEPNVAAFANWYAKRMLAYI